MKTKVGFGLAAKNGKALTAKEVKPICPFLQGFRSTYLFGAFSPINGVSFLLELPYGNSHCFKLFLNEFSILNPNELKVMVLDNETNHKAKQVKVPKNIILTFLHDPLVLN